MSQQKTVLKRTLKEKVFFASIMIFLIFPLFAHNEMGTGLTFLLLLLIMYIVATIRAFTISHLRVTEQFLFISPSPLWKTYQIKIAEIKLLQSIEQGKQRGWVIFRQNGTKIKYIPQMQDDKLITDIMTIIDRVDALKKCLVL